MATSGPGGGVDVPVPFGRVRVMPGVITGSGNIIDADAVVVSDIPRAGGLVGVSTRAIRRHGPPDGRVAVS